ncbi:hypothetical protein Ciccas_005525 [Cichlidogyrus casuarinus]|uniref:DM domain-containing protein n=1 Tax=Cichlidogyrus casuarinus TaxID=1844966 RepID=A0ABD2Q8F0_9PLAT
MDRILYRGLAMHHRERPSMDTFGDLAFKNSPFNINQTNFSPYELGIAPSFHFEDQANPLTGNSRMGMKFKSVGKSRNDFEIQKPELRSNSPQLDILEEERGSNSPGNSSGAGSMLVCNQSSNAVKSMPRASYMCRKCKAHGETSIVKQHKKECKYSNCNCTKCQLVDQGRKVGLSFPFVVAQQIALYREQKLGKEPKSGRQGRYGNSRASKRNPDPFNFMRTPNANQLTQPYNNGSSSELVNFVPGSDDRDLLSFLGRSSSTKLVLGPIASDLDDGDGQQGPHCRRCRNHSIKVTWRGHKKNCPYRNCTCDKCSLIRQRKETEKDLRSMINRDEDLGSNESMSTINQSFKSECERRSELFVKTETDCIRNPISPDALRRTDKGAYFSNYGQYLGQGRVADALEPDHYSTRTTLDNYRQGHPSNPAFGSAFEGNESANGGNYYPSFYNPDSPGAMESNYFADPIRVAQLVLASSAAKGIHHHYYYHHHYEPPNYPSPYYGYGFPGSQVESSRNNNSSGGPIIEEIDDEQQLANYSELAALPAPGDNSEGSSSASGATYVSSNCDFNRSTGTNYGLLMEKSHSFSDTSPPVECKLPEENKPSTDGPLWPSGDTNSASILGEQYA